jgi:hypothetical protein
LFKFLLFINGASEHMGKIPRVLSAPKKQKHCTHGNFWRSFLKREITEEIS